MRALLDLLFPAVCAGCGRPGRVLCDDCVLLLTTPARPRLPTPAPPLLPLPYAVADYAGAVRAVVLRYKEHEQVTLTGALATAMASSVAAAARDLASSPYALAVVPIPSSRAARRRRGFDPVLRLARASLTLLAARGIAAELVPLLRHTRAVHDSAGLTSFERAVNLAGALAAPVDASSRVAGRPVIVVDDVVTTGATLAEAGRALRAVGVGATASAVVAATVRSTGLVQKGLHNRR